MRYPATNLRGRRTIQTELPSPGRFERPGLPGRIPGYLAARTHDPTRGRLGEACLPGQILFYGIPGG